MAEKENILDSLKKTQENINNVLNFARDNHVTETKELTDYMYDTKDIVDELRTHSDLGSMVKDDPEKVLRLNTKLNNMRDQMASLVKDKGISSNKELVDVLKQNSPNIPELDDRTIMESKLNFYRQQYKSNIANIEKGTGLINKLKEGYTIDLESKETKANLQKIGEARKKYIESIKNQDESKRILGEEPIEKGKAKVGKYLDGYTDYIEKEVFNTTGDASNRALIEYDMGNRKLKKLEEIQNNLGPKIKGMIDKEGNFSYKKAVESSKAMGWGKKAAIFGGVAMAALATLGVANLAMSGGRQSNSNLYNPYQAMY